MTIQGTMATASQAIQISRPTKLDGEVSDAIRIARVLCILFMTTVHIWPGASQVLRAEVGPGLHAIYLILIDYLGRGSVPLLSVISGFLLTRSYGRKPAGRIVMGKAQALLVPMVVWSFAVLCMILARFLLTGDASDMPVGIMGWINALFALTAPPANIPVAFLRDVFVSAVFGVIALEMSRRVPALLVVLPTALIVVEVVTGGILLLRPQIVAFYMVGLWLGTGLGRLPVPPWSLVLSVLALDTGLRHGAGFPASGDSGTGLWMSYLGRIAMSLVMWRAAVEIRRQDGGLWRLARAIEPHIFLIFCSHMIPILMVAALAGSLGLRPEDALYPLIFFGQILLIVGGGILISVLGQRNAPAFLELISGKRGGG